MGLLVSGIAPDWESALMMPADVALMLLAARADLTSESGGQEGGDGQHVTRNADGSTSMGFDSIEGLSAALASAGWSGLKVGR